MIDTKRTERLDSTALTNSGTTMRWDNINTVANDARCAELRQYYKQKKSHHDANKACEVDEKVASPNLPELYDAPTALQLGYKSCLHCGNLIPIDEQDCSLCLATVHERKPQSLSKATAYLITAILFAFPANFLPTMTTSSFAHGDQDDTILSGIIFLWHHGDIPIALIVFIASIVTPIFKLISIAYLCFSCYRRSNRAIVFRTKLYHINELIGRWSMIDVFVVALLGALVQMGSLASIQPRMGIVAFALVVFFSMLSLQQFDPRLIWDNSHNHNNYNKAGE